MKIQIVVTVKSVDVRTMEGVARRTGRPYSMREQMAWVDLGKAYPQELAILLGDKQDPFEPGVYELREDAVSLDRNRNLQIDARRLRKATVPGVVATPQAAGRI
jgi:hypothetical protein